MGLCRSRAPVLKNHPDSVSFFWTDLTDLPFLFYCRSVDPLEVYKHKALLYKFRFFLGNCIGTVRAVTGSVKKDL